MRRFLIFKSVVGSSGSAASFASEISSGLPGSVGYGVLGHKPFDLDKSIAAREVQPALVILRQHLNDNLVADMNCVLDLLGPLNIKLADVDHALLAGSNFDECAEAHQAGNDALVDSADLGIVGNSLDDGYRSLCVVDIGGGNKDVAVLLNVDLAVALGADLLDDLALLADDVADLLGVDLGGEHLGAHFDSSLRGSAITGAITSSRM